MSRSSNALKGRTLRGPDQAARRPPPRRGAPPWEETFPPRGHQPAAGASCSCRPRLGRLDPLPQLGPESLDFAQDRPRTVLQRASTQGGPRAVSPLSARSTGRLRAAKGAPWGPPAGAAGREFLHWFPGQDSVGGTTPAPGKWKRAASLFPYFSSLRCPLFFSLSQCPSSCQAGNPQSLIDCRRQRSERLYGVTMLCQLEKETYEGLREMQA
jgi:hypothetical protein